MEARSSKFGSLNYYIALKFDRLFSSTAAKVPAQFQSDQKKIQSDLTILNTIFWLWEFARCYDKMSYRILKQGPGYFQELIHFQWGCTEISRVILTGMMVSFISCICWTNITQILRVNIEMYLGMFINVTSDSEIMLLMTYKIKYI